MSGSPTAQQPSASASPMPHSAGISHSAATFRNHRSLPLDSIRTVAILSVIIYHVATRYPTIDLDPVAYVFRRFGLLGVDIFFPLSGYLITGFLLRRSDTESIKIFFMRRFFRIVPLYFAAVTIFLIVSLVLGFERESLGNIWGTYLFLTGWMMFFEGRELIPYTITWSLSVEEFAYILFGICAWVARRHFLTFLILISLFAFFLRVHLNFQGIETVYNFPPARLDSIAVGGIVAVLMHRGTRGIMPALAILSVASYVVALLVPDLWSSLKYTFIAFGTCLLIVLFETRFREVRNKPLALFSAIGFYSYFIYLFHLFNIDFIFLVSERMFPDLVLPFWGVVVAAIAVTHIQAVISFRIFEGPVMRFGRSLEKRESKVPGDP